MSDPDSTDPIPAAELYDRHAEAFAEATNLDDAPEELRALLDSFVETLPGPRVLDAGCGPGRDADYFAAHDLDPVGIDVADGMLDYARANNAGAYLEMDVRNLGFEDDSFHGVWCPASIFFVPESEMATALAEFARVLCPDGVARIGFKLGDGPVEVAKWDATTVEYQVSEARARALLETAGFEVESVSVNQVSPDRTFANFCCRQTGGETETETERQE
jgi:ubiquinone/menaquinone biosynthesis C-methylase UbiE